MAVKVNDTVKVVIEAVESNGGNVECLDTEYVVAKEIENGEPMFFLKGKNNGTLLYVRENEEYAFIEEELELIECSEIEKGQGE